MSDSFSVDALLNDLDGILDGSETPTEISHFSSKSSSSSFPHRSGRFETKMSFLCH